MKCTTNHTSAAPSRGISSLPTETLCAILLIVAQTDEFPSDVLEKGTALLGMRSVCCKWYNAIQGEPQFWTKCSITFVKGSGMEGESDEGAVDHTLLDALENFYSRSGNLRLTITATCLRHACGPAVASRLSTFIVSLGARWRRIELNSHELVLGQNTSWIHCLISFASSAKESSGYSPFENVETLELNIIRILPRSFQWAMAVKDTDLASLPICHLFPNLSSLSLRFYGRTKGMEGLYKNIALPYLTTLRLTVSSGEPVILQDLLPRLPALKHLEGWGLLPDPCRPPYTHPLLESFSTRDARFHTACGSLSFPSLQRLSVALTQIDAPSPDAALPPLISMMSTCQLRALKLDNRPLTGGHIYHLLITLPTLETLVLFAPFNAEWKSEAETVFKQLIRRSETLTTLPQLTELVMHTVGRVPDECDEKEENVENYRAFCALRDSFINFVEDPRRWEHNLKLTSPRSLSDQPGIVTRHLEVAHFDHEGGVVYHRGRDDVEPLNFEL